MTRLCEIDRPRELSKQSVKKKILVQERHLISYPNGGVMIIEKSLLKSCRSVDWFCTEPDQNQRKKLHPNINSSIQFSEESQPRLRIVQCETQRSALHRNAKRKSGIALGRVCKEVQAINGISRLKYILRRMYSLKHEKTSSILSSQSFTYSVEQRSSLVPVIQSEQVIFQGITKIRTVYCKLMVLSDNNDVN